MKATTVRYVVSGFFAIAIAIANVGLLSHHGVYLLSQPNEWAAWLALLALAALYGWLLLESWDLLPKRFVPTIATLISIVLALALAYTARFAFDLIGFGINTWIVEGNRAIGAVIALGVLSSGSLLIGGPVLVAILSVKSYGWTSLSTMYAMLAAVAVGFWLEPRIF